VVIARRSRADPPLASGCADNMVSAVDVDHLAVRLIRHELVLERDADVAPVELVREEIKG
jgi:hypothetical protein